MKKKLIRVGFYKELRRRGPLVAGRYETDLRSLRAPHVLAKLRAGLGLGAKREGRVVSMRKSR